MRPVLLLALALSLAACDATPADGHALLGEWTAVGRQSSQRAVSRIDQQVPQFWTEGTGDLAVTGEARVPLAVVEGVGPSVAGVRATVEGGAELRLRESDAFASEARLTLDGSLYTAQLAVGADLFTFAGGRLTIPEITLVGQDGARGQVRVGGVLAVPMRTLRAGEEAAFSSGTTSPLRPSLGAYAIRFRDDGTVRRREILSNGGAIPTFGTWETSGDDELTLTFDGEAVSYRYRLEDRALLLERPGITLTEAEDLREVEEELFAEPGSLVQYRYFAADVLEGGA